VQITAYLILHPRLKLSTYSGDPAAANPLQAGGKLPITLHQTSSCPLEKSRTQVLARGATLFPVLLSLLGTMLPRGLGAVFLHGGAAGGHVETWRWVGHLRKYTCASSQRRGMGQPASGSLAAQIRIQSVAQNWLLAVAVILPMVVPRHLAHTRNEPGARRAGARAYM
jgi:hypothetical protein